MQESNKFQDEALSALDNQQDPVASGASPAQVGGPDGPKLPNPHNCDCDDICHDLHDDRLPKEIQVSKKKKPEIIALAMTRKPLPRT